MHFSRLLRGHVNLDFQHGGMYLCAERCRSEGAIAIHLNFECM